MHAQLLDPVGLHSTLWQQDAKLQPSVFLQEVMVPQSSSLQHLQQMCTGQPSPQLQVTGNVDVSKLKALLQDVLRSLPDSEPASGAPLQGQCVVLGAPQQPPGMQLMEPQPLQQGYVTASGQQVVLVGGPEPMLLQQKPTYTCGVENSSCMQLGSGLAWLSLAEDNQHVQVLDTQTLMSSSPTVINSAAYCMPDDPTPSSSVMLGSNSGCNNGALHAAPIGSCGGILIPPGEHSRPPLGGMLRATASSRFGVQQRMGSGTAIQRPGSYLPSPSQAHQQQLPSSSRHAGLRTSCTVRQTSAAGSPAGAGAMRGSTPGSASAAPPAPASAQAGLSAATEEGPIKILPEPWASISLDDGLQLLWNSDQVQDAVGGCMYNTAERTAWDPEGDPNGILSVQDLFDFQKLKYVVHKLDAAHRPRVRLVVRMHAAADYGGSDLKPVYFEVRCNIKDLLENAHVRGPQGVRVLGLVRLALALQEALQLGPCK